MIIQHQTTTEQALVEHKKTLDWDDVIRDAEEVLRSLKGREMRLKASIRLFRKKQQAGDPLPPGLAECVKPPSTHN